MSLRQLDLLYEEAVYTVVNRVGVPPPEHVKSDEELFSYLLKVESASLTLIVTLLLPRHRAAVCLSERE